MDVLKLKERILQYVANQDNTRMLHRWQQTADKLGITKNELEYLINEIGSDYFKENKDGFFATNKAVIEGKHGLNPSKEKPIIKVTTISGDGNTVIQESSLDNARINPTVQKTKSMTPAIAPKKSLLEILAWIAGIISGGLLIYEFVLKNIFKQP